MTECVIVGQETPITGTVNGTFIPSGLRTAGRITIVTLNAVTWTPLPLVPLTARNAMSIQNRGGTEIKINYDSAITGYEGIFIPNGFERFYDVTDAIMIYAKASAGTPDVIVEELS